MTNESLFEKTLGVMATFPEDPARCMRENGGLAGALATGLVNGTVTVREATVVGAGSPLISVPKAYRRGCGYSTYNIALLRQNGHNDLADSIEAASQSAVVAGVTVTPEELGALERAVRAAVKGLFPVTKQHLRTLLAKLGGTP